MCGLIPEWKNFSDPLNDISRLSQMGPHWLHVSRTTGAEINTRIWIDNPPVSSYPACIAVKCAEKQSKVAAYSLLKALRKAVMLGAVDISRNQHIISIAEKHFSSADDLFDFSQFESDILEGKGIEDFRKDLVLKETNQVTRIPGIILKNQNGNGLVLFGYRPYEVLEEVFENFQRQ